MAATAAEPPHSRGIDYSKFDKIEDSDDEQPQAAAAAKAAAPEKPCCHGCGKDVAKPLRCSQCQRVVYCSAQCQRSDWTYHKRACKKPEEPKAKEEARKEPPAAKEERRKKREEEKVVDNDEENLTWYRHREWKPTAEPKKDFTPKPIAPGEAAPAEAVERPTEGSAWNAAGTWEDRDVTAFAKQTMEAKLRDFVPLDCAGGALEVEAASDVDGEASKPVIRGKRRHMFDMSFKLKFVFKWMDSSGQRQAKGSLEVTDFTNDVFAEGADARPELRLGFPEGRLLDAGRKQAVEAALGAGAWPPPAGTLVAQLEGKLRAWAKEYEEAS